MRYAHAASHDVEDDTESQDAEDSITTETVRGTPSPAMSNGKEAQAASESGITTNKKRWRWDHEKEDSLISCLVEYKTKKDFEGKDMESDLVKFYEDIRQMMAAMYPIDDFGPFEISLLDPGTDLESKLRSMRTISEEKKLIKIGYGTIKDKVKLIRRLRKLWLMGHALVAEKLSLQTGTRLYRFGVPVPLSPKLQGLLHRIWMTVKRMR